MLKLLFTLILLAGAGVAFTADARTCSTSCNTVGGYTNCTTQCW